MLLIISLDYPVEQNHLAKYMHRKHDIVINIQNQQKLPEDNGARLQSKHES